MSKLSVAEAADRLGVGVPRVHQRIADGSLRAERVGSQWAVEESSLLEAAERSEPGRPFSVRSCWAIIAFAENDQQALRALRPAERSRARARLERLLDLVSGPPSSEKQVRKVAAALRWYFQNRAGRELRSAARSDLSALASDPRWESLVHSENTGIASPDVEGYLAQDDLQSLTQDHVLTSGGDANVIIHVLPAGHRSYPGSVLQLAADLAEHREPREELRAVQLLRDLPRDRAAS